MTTTINASTSSGLVNTADTSGVVKLQSNGVTTNALAWVNFSISGSTCTTNSSYNVTSVTYSSAGVYVVNYTNALADANYSNLSSCTQGGTGYISTGGTRTTTSCQVKVFSQAGSAADAVNIQFAVFGN